MERLPARPLPDRRFSDPFLPLRDKPHTLRLVRWRDAVKPVILDPAGGDFGDRQIAEERVEVETDHPPLPSDVVSVPLTQRHRFELPFEDGGRLTEGLLSRPLRRHTLRDDDRHLRHRRELPGLAEAIFSEAIEVPIARKLARDGDVRLLRRLTVVAAAQIGRALPVWAVLATIDVELALHERVRLRHMTSLPLAANV